MGYIINLEAECIAWLIRETRKLFRKEPNLIELEAPMNVFGDFHGQFFDML
jgi:serine/threonine-protein phosphatase PP1 catalytic subunit